MTTTMEFKPFYLVERLSEELGVPITYVYDDLVFLEHSDVMLQFDAVDSELLHLYINTTADQQTMEGIRDQWCQVAHQLDIRLEYTGGFAIEQTPGKEELSIRFM